MASYIPPQVAETELTRTILDAGLELLYQGKVRDTFALPGHPELLLQWATNRISIFDFVLGTLIPHKGAVLTALTHFWLTSRKLQDLHDCNHLVAAGAGIDRYLPESLRGIPSLQSNALVVRRIEMLPIEGVVRGYLTGSGLASYERDGMVCGHTLPPGLHDGSRLPEPIFTPSTKAEEGHDEHVDYMTVRKHFPRLEPLCLRLYSQAAAYAEERELILADTKFECGWGVPCELWVGDEVLTPDSSRFWDVGDWEVSQGEEKSPQGYDKQFVREEGKRVETPFGVTGINQLSPEVPEHPIWVGGVPIPDEVVDHTTGLYRELVLRLTGMSLENYQHQELGISQ